MQYTTKGKPPASREFVRAWIESTLFVLAYHGYKAREPIAIEFCQCPAGVAGRAWPQIYELEIDTIQSEHQNDPEALAATIVHELIHVVCQITDEKTCSTLATKLRPEIAKVANAMHDGHYRRAAYFAHTARGMAYSLEPGEEDGYHPEENDPVGTHDKYRQ